MDGILIIVKQNMHFTQSNLDTFVLLRDTYEVEEYFLSIVLQPSPNRAGLRKDEELQAVELTVFIHGNEKPWNNKYNTI